MPNIRPGRSGVRSYINACRKMSKTGRSTLLTEGMDDRTFFRCLAQELNIKPRIDVASDIHDQQVTNNREKVQQIARLIATANPYLDFIGFADREFDSFSIGNQEIREENVRRRYGKLIWSHGHSVENYFFEYQMMEDQLRRYYNYSDPYGYAVDALSSMEEYFPSIIRIGSAVSWAAKEKGFIRATTQALGGPLEDSILAPRDWRIVKYEDGSVRVDYDVLRTHIKLAGIQDPQLRKVDAEIEDFTDAIRNCYLPVMSQSDISSVQRLCHGHVGMAFIRYTYAMFIEYFWRMRGGNRESDPTNNLANMLTMSHWISREDGQNSWVQRYAYPSAGVRDSPIYCFEALELL